MHQLVVDAVLAAHKELLDGRVAAARRGYAAANEPRSVCALMGYDFMMSESQPYLIEVNANPYLGLQNEWHGESTAGAAAEGRLHRYFQRWKRFLISPQCPHTPHHTPHTPHAR